MPDIAMCSNPESCPKRSKCYRATATPSSVQSYMDFYNPDMLYCRDFLDLWSGTKVTKV